MWRLPAEAYLEGEWESPPGGEERQPSSSTSENNAIAGRMQHF